MESETEMERWVGELPGFGKSSYLLTHFMTRNMCAFNAGAGWYQLCGSTLPIWHHEMRDFYVRI